jgi:hypothetical protein
MKSKGVIALLIIGIILAHTFPILGAVFLPHDEITNEDMVGSDEEEEEEPFVQELNITGPLFIFGNLTIDGQFNVFGSVFIGGKLTLDNCELFGNGTIMSGMGMTQNGTIITTGVFSLTGSVGITEKMNEISGNFSGNGSISGNGTISGGGALFGYGMVSGEAPEKEEEVIEFEMGGEGYLKNGLFVIFTMLLAAIICSDIISDDLANSSFVLYFSRPTRAIDYLVGKFTGLAWVMSIFCLIPPMLYVLVMLGTQTGDNYSGGLEIFGKTILMGIFTSIFFLPYGLMVSSFTNRKAYAGVSIFVSFFVLTIISEIFSQFDNTWSLISPINMLLYTYDLLFGRTLAFGLETYQLASAILAIIIIPMLIVFIRLQRKGAGK